MSASNKNLLLLFDRPKEPIFMQKGEQGVVFDVPDNFLTDRYRVIGNEIQTRFGEGSERINVKNLTIPNLDAATRLARKEQFSLWIPSHRKCASHLIDVFMGVRNVDDLQSVAAFARDRCNPYLFNYALSVALLHRSDTKNTNLPLFVELFPDKFMDSRVIDQAREEVTVVPEGSRNPIIIPREFTASDLEEEHRLWYFREDLGINLHHWHWHLVYPFESTNRQLVDKDRRGEIFYYMHSQIQARYNFERFCNQLPRTKPLNNLREALPEGYFPKLDSLIASRNWPGRISGAVLRDINRPADQLKVEITEMERWRERFFEVIHQGFAVDERGNRIPLTEERGIDILGNIMESSILSPNRRLYGDLHNFGHVIISYAHDPDHRHLESFGVIGESPTAMRDPLFYRWHAFVEDAFQSYKETLTPYTQQQLNYPGITLTNIQIQTEGASPNTLQTFWQQSDVNLAGGMDFVPRGNVFVRFTHLQHDPFTYVLQVNNSSGAQRMGMVRIFLAPRNDERRQPILLRDQRLMMIELERFIVQLRPGQNTVRRRSTDSNVTIPYERTFRSLSNRPTDGTPQGEAFNYCGCGWPQHMLIPKGTPEGFQSELFIMISNYDEDRVDQDLTGQCNDAASYCGIRDRLYPDRKPMGYPFDRLPRTGSDRLATFLTPNMRVQQVNIVHNPNRTETRGSQ